MRIAGKIMNIIHFTDNKTIDFGNIRQPMLKLKTHLWLP
jgi:hypothetical protein